MINRYCHSMNMWLSFFFLRNWNGSDLDIDLRCRRGVYWKPMQLSPWQPPHHISTYLVPPEPMSKDFHRPPIKINFKKKKCNEKYLETYDSWPTKPTRQIPRNPWPTAKIRSKPTLTNLKLRKKKNEGGRERVPWTK